MKLITTIVLVVLCLGVLVAMIPLLGKVPSKEALQGEMSIRIENLRAWKRLIEEHENTFDELPPDLHQAVNGVVDMPEIKVNETYYGTIGELIDDPELFGQVVEYRLYSSGDEWIIVELRAGKRFTNTLMIDNNGSIYTREKLED